MHHWSTVSVETYFSNNSKSIYGLSLWLIQFCAQDADHIKNNKISKHLKEGDVAD